MRGQRTADGARQVLVVRQMVHEQRLAGRGVAGRRGGSLLAGEFLQVIQDGAATVFDIPGAGPLGQLALVRIVDVVRRAPTRRQGAARVAEVSLERSLRCCLPYGPRYGLARIAVAGSSTLFLLL